MSQRNLAQVDFAEGQLDFWVRAADWASEAASEAAALRTPGVEFITVATAIRGSCLLLVDLAVVQPVVRVVLPLQVRC